MALFRGTVRSKVLDMDTVVNVVVPYDIMARDTNPPENDKVLYLLHGRRQNADSWSRMSGVERYARKNGFTVVMPEVQHSYYSDMAYGLRYFEYVSKELPELMNAMFRLPQGREHTFVGGLSMGGFGAAKCALNNPGAYAGVMCFSSGVYILDNMKKFVESGAFTVREGEAILGEGYPVAGTENDLDMLMERWPADVEKPRFYLSCGTEDGLLPLTRKLHAALMKNGFDSTEEEWSGNHDWDFWDASLRKGMAFMK